MSDITKVEVSMARQMEGLLPELPGGCLCTWEAQRKVTDETWQWKLGRMHPDCPAHKEEPTPQCTGYPEPCAGCQ